MIPIFKKDCQENIHEIQSCALLKVMEPLFSVQWKQTECNWTRLNNPQKQNIKSLFGTTTTLQKQFWHKMATVHHPGGCCCITTKHEMGDSPTRPGSSDEVEQLALH